MKRILSLIIILGMAAQFNCAAANADIIYESSLAEKYRNFFDISSAVEPSHLETYDNLLKNQFNVLVTENQLKSWINMGEDKWHFNGGDKIVEYAQKNNMKVRAHTLVCMDFYDAYIRRNEKHNEWMTKDENGNSLFNEDGTPKEGAKELTEKRIKKHIETVIKHYKENYPGVVYAYDVVNEAYCEYGRMRDYCTIWKLLGENDDSWINKCFKWAHEADPEAVLIYNDNGFTSDIAKQNKIYDKIRELREEGLPVQIGMQMHYSTNTSLEEVETLLKRFSNLCDIYVTELDMESVAYPAPDGTTYINNGRTYATFNKKLSYPDFMEEEAETYQAMRYAGLFDLFRKYSDKIKSVGFWGVCDGQSESMNEYKRLLFGENGEPKKVYDGVVDFDFNMPRSCENDIAPRAKSFNWELDEKQLKITALPEEYGKNVTYKLYKSNDPGKNPLDNLTVVDSTSVTAKEGTTVSFNLPSNSLGKTFVVSRTLNGEEKKDYFYDMPSGADEDYTIEDDLNDFEKIYKYEKVELGSSLSVHDDDFAGIYPQYQPETEDKYIMYKVPENRNISAVEVDSYLFRQGSSFPQIFASKDGETFVEIANDNSWKYFKYADYNGVKANINDIASGYKYLKIDFGKNSLSWESYISRVKIETTEANDTAAFIGKISEKSGTAEFYGTSEKFGGKTAQLIISDAANGSHIGKFNVLISDSGKWYKEIDLRTFLNNADTKSFKASLICGNSVVGEKYFTYNKPGKIYDKFNVIYEDTTDNCENFNNIYEYQNFEQYDVGAKKIGKALLKRSATESYVTYKAADGKAFNKVFIKFGAKDGKQIFPVIQCSDDNKNWESLTTVCETPAYTFDEVYKKTLHGSADSNTDWYSLFENNESVSVPMKKYVRIYIPQYEPEPNAWPRIALTNVSLGVGSVTEISEDTTDLFTNLNNTYYTENLEIVDMAEKYPNYNKGNPNGLGTVAARPIKVDTEAKLIYKSEKGKYFNKVKFTVSAWDSVLYPDVEYSKDGKVWTSILTVQQSEKAYSTSDWKTTGAMSGSAENPTTGEAHWCRWNAFEYSFDNAGARYIRVTIPANAAKKDHLVFKAAELKISEMAGEKLLSKTTEDDCADFMNAYSMANFKQWKPEVILDKEPNQDGTTWVQDDKTKASEVVYKTAKGKSFSGIYIEAVINNQVNFPQVSYKNASGEWKVLVARNTDADYKNDGWQVGWMEKTNEHWYSKAELTKETLPEDATEIKISFNENDNTEGGTFAIRKVKLYVADTYKLKLQGTTLQIAAKTGAKSANLIIAEYDANDELVNVTKETVSFENGSVEKTLQEPAQGGYVKAFLFDEMIYPLTNSVSSKQV